MALIVEVPCHHGDCGAPGACKRFIPWQDSMTGVIDLKVHRHDPLTTSRMSLITNVEAGEILHRKVLIQKGRSNVSTAPQQQEQIRRRNIDSCYTKLIFIDVYVINNLAYTILYDHPLIISNAPRTSPYHFY